MKRTLMTGLAAVAVAGAVPATAQAAVPQATTAALSCPSSLAEGSVYGAWTQRRNTSFAYGSRTLTVRLVSGDVSGVQYAFAQVYDRAHTGDAVWIDVTNVYTGNPKGSYTHKQCGFKNTDDYGASVTRDFRTSAASAVAFRACGGIKVSGGYQVACTQWW